MTQLRLVLIVVSSVLLAATQSGCLLVAAGAAAGTTVAYVKGDTDASIRATPDQVAAAAEVAMQELSINVISRQASKLDARVVGRTARDTKLAVTAKSEGAVSRVSVRAGVFGDNAIQAQLLEKIRARIDGVRSDSLPATQPAPLATSRPVDAVAGTQE